MPLSIDAAVASALPSLPDQFPSTNFIVLAGIPSPGLAIVRGASSPRKWDLRPGYGLNGATAVCIGRDVSKFSVDIFLWEQAHALQWKLFSQIFSAPPLTMLSIVHPALNSPPIYIEQVQIENVTQLEQDPDGGGLWCSSISFFEYKKPLPMLLKPFKGPPAVVTAAVVPKTPEEINTAAKIATLNKLSGG